MSKREREDERPDETPVTVIDLQATTGLLFTKFFTDLFNRFWSLNIAACYTF